MLLKVFLAGDQFLRTVLMQGKTLQSMLYRFFSVQWANAPHVTDSITIIVEPFLLHAI